MSDNLVFVSENTEVLVITNLQPSAELEATSVVLEEVAIQPLEDFVVGIDQTILTFVLSSEPGNAAVTDSNGLLYVSGSELASTNW